MVVITPIYPIYKKVTTNLQTIYHPRSKHCYVFISRASGLCPHELPMSNSCTAGHCQADWVLAMLLGLKWADFVRSNTPIFCLVLLFGFVIWGCTFLQWQSIIGAGKIGTTARDDVTLALQTSQDGTIFPGKDSERV